MAILFHVFQKGLKRRRLLGQLLVVPGRGRIGGQRQHVGQIHAGVDVGIVDVRGEVEDLREQNHAVQIDALVVLQNVGQHRRARGAVALAEDVLGRVPAVVLGDETLNEARKGVGVFIHAPEGLSRVFAGEAAEAGAGHVDKNQIAGVEQRVGVVHKFVGRGGQVLVAVRSPRAWGRASPCAARRSSCPARRCKRRLRADLPPSRPS